MRSTLLLMLSAQGYLHATTFFSALTYNLHMLVERGPTGFPTESLDTLRSAPSTRSKIIQQIKSLRADVLLLQEIPTSAFFGSCKSFRQAQEISAPCEDQAALFKSEMGAAGYDEVVCQQASTFLKNCIYAKKGLSIQADTGNSKALGTKRSMAVAKVTLPALQQPITLVATHVDQSTIGALSSALSSISGPVIAGADYNLSLPQVSQSLSGYTCGQECQGNGKVAFPHNLTMATKRSFDPIAQKDGEEVDFLMLSPDAKQALTTVRVEYGKTVISDHIPVFMNFALSGLTTASAQQQTQGSSPNSSPSSINSTPCIILLPILFTLL